MPNKTEILAALKAHASEIEALIESVKTLGLSGFDLKSQGESGLEIRRILNRLTEMCCDVEMRVIDVHRAYGDQPAMTELERKLFRAGRADEVSDLTYDAHEQMMEYLYGGGSVMAENLDQPKELKDIRFQMMLAPSEVNEIENWMFANRIKSRAEAIRRLVKLGLEQSELLAELCKAESFISGFDDDELQEGIAELLDRVRAAIAKARGDAHA